MGLKKTKAVVIPLPSAKVPENEAECSTEVSRFETECGGTFIVRKHKTNGSVLCLPTPKSGSKAKHGHFFGYLKDEETKAKFDALVASTVKLVEMNCWTKVALILDTEFTGKAGAWICTSAFGMGSKTLTVTSDPHEFKYEARKQVFSKLRLAVPGVFEFIDRKGDKETRDEGVAKAAAAKKANEKRAAAYAKRMLG